MSIFGNLEGILGNLIDEHGGPQAALTEVFNRMGGVQGVLGQLQQAGLGGQVASWIGTGANQSVSPGQVGGALGHGPMADIAAKLGMTPDQLNGIIAKTLPVIIDRLSPNGTLQPHLLAGGGASPPAPAS